MIDGRLQVSDINKIVFNAQIIILVNLEYILQNKTGIQFYIPDLILDLYNYLTQL